MTHNETGSGLRPSRRTVVKGAAWAVPAVAVAASTPASASSPVPPEIQFGESQLCKLPGASQADNCYDKGYVAFLVFDNTANTQPYYLCSVESFTAKGAELCVVGISEVTSSEACQTLVAPNDGILIPAEQEVTVAVWTNSSSSSASGTFQVTFTGSFEGCPSVDAPEVQSGHLTGSSWPGDDQGSCKPPAACTTVPSACDSICATTA